MIATRQVKWLRGFSSGHRGPLLPRLALLCNNSLFVCAVCWTRWTSRMLRAKRTSSGMQYTVMLAFTFHTLVSLLDTDPPSTHTHTQQKVWLWNFWYSSIIEAVNMRMHAFLLYILVLHNVHLLHSTILEIISLGILVVDVTLCGTCWFISFQRTDAFLFFPKVVLDKEKQTAVVDREVDGGLETLCLDLSAVITCVSFTLHFPKAVLPRLFTFLSYPCLTLCFALLE